MFYNRMQNDERNFRSSYYEKVGCRSVEEKRSIEILFKDKLLDKNKIGDFCLRFNVPISYRLLVWKLLLGVLPVHKDCQKFVSRQRELQYNNLLSSLLKMRLIKKRTPKAQAFVEMWLVENGNLKLNYKTQMEEPFNKHLVIISTTLVKVFDNDVDVYWISKGFFECVKSWSDRVPSMADSTRKLLKKEDNILYTHLVKIDVLLKVPFEEWFCCCFAGTIHESALVKIWDKVVGGSISVLMFVCIVLLTTLRRVILKCQAFAEIMSCVCTMAAIQLVSLIYLVLFINLKFDTVSAIRVVKKIPNNIISIKSECSSSNFNITLELEREFQGIIYAQGFPLECRALGSKESSVSLQLPVSGCGVRIIPSKQGGLVYNVIVEVQMARYLQQISDPNVAVSCHLPEEKMVLHSPALQLEKQNSRSGRMMGDVSSSLYTSGKEKWQARAWLEIEGSPISQYEDTNSICVGEHTSLLVKTWLPASVGARVVNCLAHDGLGDTSQVLSDNMGCPVDELIVPRFRVSTNSTLDGYALSVHSASFPAFKFPDRDIVQIRCGLQLCRGVCSEIDCNHKGNTSRTGRKMKGEEGEVLDYIQLFNSVKVIAPGIEMEGIKRTDYYHSSDEPLTSKLLADEFGAQPFCLSASRMAMAFASLGLVFLTAVAISLYVLLRNRLQRQGYGDQNFLVIRDSPSLMISPPSRSSMSAWSYGRI